MNQHIKKKTVGQVSSELQTKQPETGSVIDKTREMQEDYMKNLLEAVDRGYKEFPSDFFTIVVTKNEKLMPNVFRNYFFNTIACPTPTYDQTVFRYNREAGRIEYLFTIPSKDACIYLKNNAHLVAKEEQELLGFVLKFHSGELDKYVKKLNGEEKDSIKIIES